MKSIKAKISAFGVNKQSLKDVIHLNGLSTVFLTKATSANFFKIPSHNEWGYYSKCTYVWTEVIILKQLSFFRWKKEPRFSFCVFNEQISANFSFQSWGLLFFNQASERRVFPIHSHCNSHDKPESVTASPKTTGSIQAAILFGFLCNFTTSFQLGFNSLLQRDSVSILPWGLSTCLFWKSFLIF